MIGQLQSVLALFSLASAILVASTAKPVELTPWDLWARSSIRQVSVSPSGEWVTGVARHADRQGILAQRRGEGVSVPLYGSSNVILHTTWIGDDTLFVAHPSQDPLKAVVIRLRAGENTILHDMLEVREFGYIVNPLSEEDQIVLWADYARDRWVVRRGPVSGLAFGKKWKTSGRWAEGKLVTVAEQRNRVERWLADHKGVVRAALVLEGRRTLTPALRYRGGLNDSWRTVWRGNEEDEVVWPLGITADDSRLIVAAFGEYDTRGLHEFDPDSGRLVREIFRRPNLDVTGARFDYSGVEVIAAEYREAGAIAYHYLADFQAKHLPGIDELRLDDSVSITSSSRDHRFFTLFAFGARDPGTYYFFEKETKKLTSVGEVNARVSRGSLVRMRSFNVVSSDGAHIEAYLATPDRSDAKLPPLLVYPHGGPIGVQDDRSFDPMVQLIANAGIAVLKVNYRGSDGYGRRFLESGARQWGRGIEDDIDAAVQFVIDAGHVDPERICIAGGSYGGYSALISAIRSPERYRCVVTINGVTDLPLMLANLWGWPGARKFLRKVVGDLESDFDSIMEVSPVYHVEKLQAPVMIIQGSKDTRVDPDHAYRLRAMMEAHGKAFEWLEIPAMEHAPNRKEWITIAQALKWFVTCHLGEMPADRSYPWNGQVCEPGS